MGQEGNYHLTAPLMAELAIGTGAGVAALSWANQNSIAARSVPAGALFVAVCNHHSRKTGADCIIRGRFTFRRNVNYEAITVCITQEGKIFPFLYVMVSIGEGFEMLYSCDHLSNKGATNTAGSVRKIPGLIVTK